MLPAAVFMKTRKNNSSYSLQYIVFENATNEPQTALAILFSELHLHTDTTHPHSHISRWLCTACQEVGMKQKQCKCITDFIAFIYFVATEGTEKYGEILTVNYYLFENLTK